MKNAKTIVPSAAAIIASLGLLTPGAAQANLLNLNGTSVLANSLGQNSGPEALTVNWSVTEDASFLYTYSYTINNPTGDDLYDNDGTVQDPIYVLSDTPEVVDSYVLNFNADLPGAVVSSGSAFDLGPAGLYWLFSDISPGGNLTVNFTSDLPPVMGVANADDDNTPAPWSSLPDGQLVPIPGIAIVPDGANTMLLLGGVLTMLPFRSVLKKALRK